MKKTLLFGIASLAFFLGCSQSPQEKAYNDALQLEGQYADTPGQAAPMLIKQYRNVISMDPNSRWADSARIRIDLLQKIVQEDQGSSPGK